MGKLINGINGPFLGKVGTGIGSSWKGIPYIKGPYKKRTGKASKAEKGNRNKFGMAQRWLQPALVKLSHGSLPLPADIKLEKQNGSQLQFSWNPAGTEDGHPKDQVMLLAYDIDHSQVTTVIPGQFRETGADSMELPPEEMRTWHIYLAFVAQDRSRQSDSLYLGNIVTG